MAAEVEGALFRLVQTDSQLESGVTSGSTGSLAALWTCKHPVPRRLLVGRQGGHLMEAQLSAVGLRSLLERAPVDPARDRPDKAGPAPAAVGADTSVRIAIGKRGPALPRTRCCGAVLIAAGYSVSGPVTRPSFPPPRRSEARRVTGVRYICHPRLRLGRGEAAWNAFGLSNHVSAMPSYGLSGCAGSAITSRWMYLARARDIHPERPMRIPPVAAKLLALHPLAAALAEP
jgi:hypothetical protein